MQTVKLKDLDDWYRAQEAEIGLMLDVLGMKWETMGYDQKLRSYQAFFSTAVSRLRNDSGQDALHSYHLQSNTAAYYRANRLNHYSGDYRPWWKKVWYRVLRWSGCTDYQKLSRFNNLHWRERQ